MDASANKVKQVWTTGKFKCADQIAMQNDGNLVSSCDNKYNVEKMSGPKDIGYRGFQT